MEKVLDVTWSDLNSSPLDKMAAILQMVFSDAFSWMKGFVFDRNFIKVCFLGPSWQAIILTNVYPVHWRIYAALGGDELNTCIV